jgi:uncharacterized protein
MTLRSRARRFTSQPLISGWMVNGTRVIASVNIASARVDKRRGLKAFDDAEIPLVIQPCNWVHSIGMKFPIDVVYLDENDVIVKIAHLKQNRIALPRRRAIRVVETAPGAFRHWGLKVGDHVEFRGAEMPTERNWRPTP